MRPGGLNGATARQPSRLPGWTVGHVLTHPARNADADDRRLQGALHGTATAKYSGGLQQREQEIDFGTERLAAELYADLQVSQQRLEDTFTACSAANWPGRKPG